MSFWSGEKLAEELSKGLVNPYSPDNLDCASYRLCVGDEAFVTSDKFQTSAPGDPLITKLGEVPQHTLRIHPGQFAFVLTKEIVTVPKNAIALISMRAKFKFQGLINVSGFHVDPGWCGKLLFSVYNAGANEVIISKDEQLFLIVYSSLDRESTKTYKGSSHNQKTINTEWIKGMTGQVFSPLMLQRKIDALRTEIDTQKANAQKLSNITYSVSIVVGIILAAGALLVTMLPGITGVIVAKTLEAAGYEVKQKDTAVSTTIAPNKDAAHIPTAPASAPK